MKQSLLFLTFFLFSISQAIGQFEIGLKGGMHSVDLISDGITLPNGDGQGLNLNYKDSKYGFHFGLYTRLTLIGIYVEPSFLLNTTSVDYTLEQLGDDGIFNVIKNETYNSFDIPVMIGIKAGILRMYGGPVAHLNINGSSDLIDFPGYEQRFKDASYGFQAGIGLDLWKIRLNLAYEGNLSKFGDHITIDGQPFAFDSSVSRLLMTAGWKF